MTEPAFPPPPPYVPAPPPPYVPTPPAGRASRGGLVGFVAGALTVALAVGGFAAYRAATDDPAPAPAALAAAQTGAGSPTITVPAPLRDAVDCLRSKSLDPANRAQTRDAITSCLPKDSLQQLGTAVQGMLLEGVTIDGAPATLAGLEAKMTGVQQCLAAKGLDPAATTTPPTAADLDKIKAALTACLPAGLAITLPDGSHLGLADFEAKAGALQQCLADHGLDPAATTAPPTAADLDKIKAALTACLPIR